MVIHVTIYQVVNLYIFWKAVPALHIAYVSYYIFVQLLIYSKYCYRHYLYLKYPTQINSFTVRFISSRYCKHKSKTSISRWTCTS